MSSPSHRPALSYEELIVFDPVDEAMLPVQPPRPPAGQRAFERFRLAGTIKWRTHAFVDEVVQAEEQLAVVLLPVKIISPSLLVEDDLHSINCRSVPLPASSSCTAFKSRCAFSGLLSR